MLKRLLFVVLLALALTSIAQTNDAWSEALEEWIATHGDQGFFTLVAWGAMIWLALAFVQRIICGRPCPKCRRWHAIRRTGRERGYARDEEWGCRHCDYRIWKEDDTD